MDELPSYQFDGYTFRPAVIADLPLARAWNEADPDHGWELQRPFYWIEQTLVTNSYVLEDQYGAVFFLKAIRTRAYQIEINIQFDRTFMTVGEVRTRRAMRLGFQWLKRILVPNAIDVVCFKTPNDRLARFAEKMGFRKEGPYWIYVSTQTAEACAQGATL